MNGWSIFVIIDGEYTEFPLIGTEEENEATQKYCWEKAKEYWRSCCNKNNS